MRTSNLFRTAAALVMALALILMPSMLEASPNTTAAQTISLSYTINESLTLTLGATTATFAPNGPGNAASTSPFSLTAAWTLNSGRNAVDIVGYFSSTTALVSGSNSVPTANVWTHQTGTNATADCSGSWSTVDGFANACLFFTNTTPGITGTGTVNVTLTLPANATNLNPGVYTGTLNVVAQAN